MLALTLAFIAVPWTLILLILLIAVCIAAVVAAKVLTARKRGDATPDEPHFPYESQPLLSNAEASFLRVLDLAVDGRARVFAKVRLADLIATKRGLSNSERAKAFNRIQSKHVDFVLCDPDTLIPLAALELDDRSHERNDRRERDDFVDRACAAASLHVIHMRAGHGYSVHELRRELDGVVVQSGRVRDGIVA